MAINDVEKALLKAVGEIKKNPQTPIRPQVWDKLFTYVPEEVLMQAADLLKSMQAIEKALADPNVWCTKCQHEWADENTGLCYYCSPKEKENESR